jgi:hypothetical protein
VHGEDRDDRGADLAGELPDLGTVTLSLGREQDEAVDDEEDPGDRRRSRSIRSIRPSD